MTKHCCHHPRIMNRRLGWRLLGILAMFVVLHRPSSSMAAAAWSPSSSVFKSSPTRLLFSAAPAAASHHPIHSNVHNHRPFPLPKIPLVRPQTSRDGLPRLLSTVQPQRQRSTSRWTLVSLARRPNTNDDGDTTNNEKAIPTNTNINDTDNSSSSSSNAAVALVLLRDSAKTLRRASWFSWWSQVILTVIAGVILGFAQSTAIPTPMGGGGGSSFFLSGCGLLWSAASIVWTWGNGARLSRRLSPTTTTSSSSSSSSSTPRKSKSSSANANTNVMNPLAAARMLRRAVRVGVTLNLLGLCTNLLAAQQIIGTLAIKVLTRGGSGFAAVGAAGLYDGGGFLQPLDILIVQANANQLLSHFCSLVSLLYLTFNIDQLDPPSTEESPRRLSLPNQ